MRDSEREEEKEHMDKKYEKFLVKKRIVDTNAGIDAKKLNKMFFPFQESITKWALRKGRAAIFADCGMGKTPMQLEYSRKANRHTKKPSLILAPLAVSKQTKREGDKFGIKVNVCRKQADIINGINITNYEMIQHFEQDEFGCIVLDESSILKGYNGKFRQEITEFAKEIPFRLGCTATPAPNDIQEIINHAEFLGIMNAKEILALFFIQDGNTTHKWRLKHHATNDFWKWMASWSVAIRKPSDIGFDDDGFILPPLNLKQIIIPASNQDIKNGMLIPMVASTLKERRDARRNSLSKKVEICAEMVNRSKEQWLIWCDLNKESEELANAIGDAVEVKGSNDTNHKENSMMNFQNGKLRVLVTKPSIAGFGMNWQNCHNMVFVGLSDSYEKLYQATRRCWRFGQKETVNSYHIISETEGSVLKNIERKEREAKTLFDNVIKNMNKAGQAKTKREEVKYITETKKGKNWTLYLGDSVLVTKEIESESIGLSVFSPPFPGMYVYTNSRHDMGNTKTIDELIDQYGYLAPEILRITKPGRSCCVHLCQAIAFKNKDGYIGVKDFRGKIISEMEKHGWIYYGEVCIDKDPQVKAIRTKDRGLLFKSLATDASHLHMGLADYLLQFKKPGDNPEPIKAGISKKYNSDGWITSEEWIEWAAPVWYRQTKNYPGGIRETDVLNVKLARDKKDEKHLAPLQLGVIERAVKLWSNPGDVVFSPFAGVGSEGYVALKLNRKFIGVELKDSYYNRAVKFLKSVDGKGMTKVNLFQVGK